MKIDPELAEPNVCQTSIDMLYERCLAVLPSHGIPSPVFPDHQSFPTRIHDRDTKLLDVVFFGSFLRRFMESGNWPNRNYRLWTLSPAAQRVLIEVCGVPADRVGVIPRYLLFPRALSPAPFPKLTKEACSFVYGGRLSATKNIEFLLRTVSTLQTELECPVTVSLFGSADDDYHFDYGRRVHERYIDNLIALTKKLPWAEPPVFHGKLQPAEWIEASRTRKPIYVNFSSFYQEDFGVALAQAQAAGWPALVSDWGGLQAADGDNLVKIPLDWIAPSHSPPEIQELKARNLASILARGPGLLKVTEAEIENSGISMPVPVSSREIDAFRRALFEKTGPDLHLWHRESPERFADTETGRRFFAKFRQHFSGSSTKPSTWVLINDLHPTKQAELRNIGRIAHRLIELTRSGDDILNFAEASEVLQPVRRSSLLCATKIVIPFIDIGIVAFLTSLLRADLETPLRILFNRAQAPEGLNAVRSVLRPQDRVIEYDEGAISRLTLEDLA